MRTLSLAATAVAVFVTFQHPETGEPVTINASAVRSVEFNRPTPAKCPNLVRFVDTIKPACITATPEQFLRALNAAGG